MRVVGGEARGRRLRAPKDRKIRPTADRIRESIFDLLGIGPFDGNVLDLFAGTGALGIEALSRGFAKATFVENSKEALALISENLSCCGYGSLARMMAQEALSFLEQLDPSAPFRLVLLDPPYHQGLVRQVLERLGQGGWVAEDGFVVAEGEADLELPERIGSLVRWKRKRYGDTSVTLFVQKVACSRLPVDNLSSVR
jgi:16S rRNA (guanine966-N2)-methyltransferase